jgi:hypothetical protein
MILASIESLLGSIWFAGLLGVLGYIAGHIFPVSFFSKKTK